VLNTRLLELGNVMSIAIEPGQVWENVKHSPLHGRLTPKMPELVSLMIVRPWRDDVEDPLWVVSFDVPIIQRCQYFELESVIRTGTLKR
jgi:hypothetical protein